MFGNTMYSTVEYGSNIIYTQGYNLDNLEEENLMFEAGKSIDGDDGSSF